MFDTSDISNIDPWALHKKSFLDTFSFDTSRSKNRISLNVLKVNGQGYRHITPKVSHFTRLLTETLTFQI